MPDQLYSQKVPSLRERALEQWSRGCYELSDLVLEGEAPGNFDWRVSEGPRCGYLQHFSRSFQV